MQEGCGILKNDVGKKNTIPYAIIFAKILFSVENFDNNFSVAWTKKLLSNKNHLTRMNSFSRTPALIPVNAHG